MNKNNMEQKLTEENLISNNGSNKLKDELEEIISSSFKENEILSLSSMVETSGISRSTFFGWKRKNLIKEGVHYKLVNSHRSPTNKEYCFTKQHIKNLVKLRRERIG